MDVAVLEELANDCHDRSEVAAVLVRGGVGHVGEED